MARNHATARLDCPKPIPDVRRQAFKVSRGWIFKEETKRYTAVFARQMVRSLYSFSPFANCLAIFLFSSLLFSTKSQIYVRNV